MTETEKHIDGAESGAGVSTQGQGCRKRQPGAQPVTPRMTARIPDNVRANYEHTHYLIHQARCFITASLWMQFVDEHREKGTLEHATAELLLDMASEKLAEVEKAHDAEWVGLGGDSGGLTPEEIAAARGQSGNLDSRLSFP
ncbi:hypothetical protein [Rhodosalinus sp. K401]|uniref:hypothetical protein n=1 Tax=Rhodosalinus sp. K401 TaxID=3239195 RepID=UPI00352607A4